MTEQECRKRLAVYLRQYSDVEHKIIYYGFKKFAFVVQFTDGNGIRQTHIFEDISEVKK